MDVPQDTEDRKEEKTIEDALRAFSIVAHEAAHDAANAAADFKHELDVIKTDEIRARVTPRASLSPTPSDHPSS